jgi:hypothetical protein
MFRNIRRKLRIFGIVFAALALTSLIRGQFALRVGTEQRVIARSDDPGKFWTVEAGGVVLAAVCLFMSL